MVIVPADPLSLSNTIPLQLGSQRATYYPYPFKLPSLEMFT